MPRDTFLFVPYRTGKNHGANTNFKQAGVSDSDARSHAAAVSRRRRELNARTNGLANTELRTVAQSPGTSPTESRTDDQEEGCSPASPSSTQSPSVKTREQRRQNMRTMQFSWRAGTISADCSLSNGWRSDPFSIISTNSYVDAIVDYYSQVITPVNHPIYAIFDVTNVYTSFFLELLQNEDYHPAGLAMVGAIMPKVSDSRGNPPDEVRKNQGKAIARLQRKWKNAIEKGESPADDIAIITVVALASLARLLGDLNAYKVHRKNMGEMVCSRGGLKALGHDGLTQCLLMQWDSFWVFQTEGTSLFPDSRPPLAPVYPVFPLSAEMRPNFQKLPIGFQALVIQGKVSVELVEVLARAADASVFGVDSIASGNIYHTQHRRYRDFVEACPSLGASDTGDPNLEKLLCLALLLYCANTFTSARTSTALYGGAKVELTRSLSRHENNWKTPAEEECGFWISVVCVDSWRAGKVGSTLLDQGKALLPVLKANKHSQEHQKILKKFFWTDELLTGCQRYLDMPS